MKRVWLVVGLLVAVGQAGAASGAITCPATSVLPVPTSITDKYGRDASLGADVAYMQTAVGRLVPSTRYPGEYSEIDTYTLFVSKPWYQTTVKRGVQVRVGRCGIEPSGRVEVVLYLKPGAPRLRSVGLWIRQDYTQYVPPGCPQWAKLEAVVDANPGVNTAVSWASSDPNVATVDQSGYVQAALCHATPATVTITATSKADPRVKQSRELSFGRSSARCPKS